MKLEPKKKSLIIVLLILVLIAVVGFWLWHGNTSTDNPKGTQSQVNILQGDMVINVNIEYAKTQSEQEKGLMYRKSIGDNEGMLFVFPDEKIQTFWMKNTYIPLDMLFFDTKGNLTSISENAATCVDRGNDCPTYASTGPAKYVLEVTAGWAKKNNVAVNSSLLDLTSVK